MVCSHPEVPSWCEDESKEESMVKKIPITGKSNGCILTSNPVFNSTRSSKHWYFSALGLLIVSKFSYYILSAKIKRKIINSVLMLTYTKMDNNQHLFNLL